jgi:hypothetical protein
MNVAGRDPRANDTRDALILWRFNVASRQS